MASWRDTNAVTMKNLSKASIRLITERESYLQEEGLMKCKIRQLKFEVKRSKNLSTTYEEYLDKVETKLARYLVADNKECVCAGDEVCGQKMICYRVQKAVEKVKSEENRVENILEQVENENANEVNLNESDIDAIVNLAK